MLPPQVPTVTVDQVPPDAVLLDVREDDEWAAGHIAGARHIPLSALVSRFSDVPPGHVVVVCRVGSRSASATAYLASQGIDAVNLHGGMLAWEAYGRPMVSSTGGEPVVL